jgi:hypothetical protein
MTPYSGDQPKNAAPLDDFADLRRLEKAKSKICTEYAVFAGVRHFGVLLWWRREPGQLGGSKLSELRRTRWRSKP